MARYKRELKSLNRDKPSPRRRLPPRTLVVLARRRGSNPPPDIHSIPPLFLSPLFPAPPSGTNCARQRRRIPRDRRLSGSSAAVPAWFRALRGGGRTSSPPVFLRGLVNCCPHNSDVAYEFSSYRTLFFSCLISCALFIHLCAFYKLNDDGRSQSGVCSLFFPFELSSNHLK